MNLKNPLSSLPLFPKKIFNRTVGYCVLGGVVVAAGAGVGGFYLGERHITGTTNGVDMSLFWKAWSVINSNFYGNTGDTTARVNGAISGMVASLNDQWTLYLPPSENNVFQSTLQGSFGGIGASLEVDNNQLTIVSVLSGTPAEKAGLKAQDVITKINGKQVGSLTFDDAIAAIRGTKGTVVTLTIARAGHSAAFDVPVTRDTITVKSVSTDTIGTNGDIEYIKVNQFGSDTEALFQQGLEDAVTNHKKGVIIDLRDNPGGYLDAARDMIGMVLPSTIDSTKQVLEDRVAVLEKDKSGNTTDDQAGSTVIAPTIPMVVLVNGGSASAAEIFTGAMEDYKRATVVGTKTFGKGSVQDLIDLGNGGSIKVTIAKWFTPLGTGIDGKGLQPDITVTLPENVTTSESDAQVQKALSLLPQ